MRDEAEAPDLAEQFHRFGVSAGRDGAHLYDTLCQSIAGDDDLLSLMARAPLAQRRPNLLLAAVHYLLLAGTDDPLADHYPTVAEWRGTARRPPTGDDVRADFRSFCDRHRDRVASLLATRSTQTNEVGRCTALLPAFATVSRDHGRPLALIDLGASAGLNLFFDRYAYTYTGPPDGRITEAGPAGSPVHLQAELREGELPDLGLPAVAHRAGVDRDPVDPSDGDRSLWLLACQWPDHLERFRRLRDALSLARAIPDREPVARGNIVDDLPAAAAAAPIDSHLCVYNTWVAAYLTPERQTGLDAAVAAVAARRPVSWLFAESPYEVPALPVPPAPGDRVVKGATALVLIDMDGDRRRARRLADVHHHGAWLHWWG